MKALILFRPYYTPPAHVPLVLLFLVCAAKRDKAPEADSKVKVACI